MQAWWTKKFKPCWIEMSVIIVGMTALFFLTRNALFLLFDFMAAFTYIFFYESKKAVKVERHIDFTSVIKILETKKLIVLLLKGNMNIPLSKTAFIEGTWEDCLSYLKTMTKQ